MVQQPAVSYTLKRKTGGNILNERPIFYDQNNILIVPHGGEIRFYSTATGDLLPQVIHNKSDVISCHNHPLDSSKVVACTSEGEIITFSRSSEGVIESSRDKLMLNFDYLNHVADPLLKGGTLESITWSSSIPITYHYFELCVKKEYNQVMAFVSWSCDSEDQTHLSSFNFNNYKMNKIHFKVKLLTKKQNFVIIQNSILVGMSKHSVKVFDLTSKTPNKYIKHFIGEANELCCIVAHPKELSFATGDNIGRITLWNNILAKRPLKSVLHWHSVEVHCIVYSPDGSHVYSGGEEKVLVKWSTHTLRNHFLPRLSASIIHVVCSPNHSMLSVSTLDSRIVIMNSNFHCVSTIQHFSSWSAVNIHGKQNKVLTFDPRTNSVVMNGKTGHLQFLSANENGRFLYTLDITNRNVVTGGGASSAQTDVTLAKFSLSGLWLVTAETNTNSESRLKFWMFDEIKQTFKLNSDIANPHESDIHALEYAHEDLVVTTGSDLTFKLWVPHEGKVGTQTKVFWSCCGSESYRSLSPNPADFSYDNSLVAVGFGPILTIWDALNCSLKCSLTPFFNKRNINAVKFGNVECSHLIVSVTDSCLSSWNLISLTRIWTVPSKICVLSADPFSSTMAAFSLNNDMFLFKPTSPNLIFQFLNCSSRKVVSATWVLRNQTKDSLQKLSQLFFINENQEFLALESEDVEDMEVVQNDSSFITPFAALIPQQNKSTIPQMKDMKQSVGKLDLKYTTQILMSPAYTLPPVSMLCYDFLKNLTLKENKKSSKPEVKIIKSKNFKYLEEDSKKQESSKDLNELFNQLFTDEG